MTYTWKNNLACKATYAINTEVLEQIAAELVPIEKAGDYKIEWMSHYPDDASAKLKEKWAKKISAKFIQFVIKFYDVKKQRDDTSKKKWFKETWPIYKDGDKTLTDLAEVLDKHCKFSDED